MNKLAEIAERLRELEKEREKLERERLCLEKKRMIQCVGCGKRSALSKWVFEQHYCKDYSGDDHRVSTEHCGIVCPKCQKRHYIVNHPRKKKILEIVERYTKHKVFNKVVDMA